MTNRVVIAAYNPIILSGIKSILKERNSGFKIVGEATSIEMFLKLLEHTHPDIAIVDVGLTWRSGVDFAEEVERRSRFVKIVPISVHPIDQYALTGLKSRMHNLNMPLHEWENLLRLNVETAYN